MKKKINSESSSTNEKDKLIMDEYLMKKLKPSNIALQRKWDKINDYWVVDSRKRVFSLIKQMRFSDQSLSKMNKANSFVQEYIEKPKHTWFRVLQVN